MLKKSLLLMTIISLNILPGFASEEQKEEKKSFFPQNFTASSLEELMDSKKRETKDGFRVYRINEEDHKTLVSYQTQWFQPGTMFFNPLNGRVKFGQVSWYETIDDYSIEDIQDLNKRDIIKSMIEAKEAQEQEKETRILKTFKGKYTLRGSWTESPADISITGSYDIFRLIFSNENFNENGLCLHRLQELDETFTNQTSNAHRLNQTLSKLFYAREALRQPETYPLTYNKTAEELGRKWFVEYMITKKIPAEKCTAVLLKGEDTDPALISLETEFYTSTVNVLRDDIYALMGIDKALLNSMYEGIGTHMINYDYTVAALEVARGS